MVKMKSLRSLLGVFFAFSILFSVFATTISVQAANETFTGDTNITGLITEGIPITDLQISGDGNEELDVTLHAEHGTLAIATTDDLIFSTSNPAQTLRFSGTRTAINTALASMQYSAYELGVFTIEATIGGGEGEVYSPENSHVYQVVQAVGEGISWNDANTAAAGMTYGGADGYLATITSEAENDFIYSRLSQNGWIGASDSVSDGDWQWVTGPEIGTSFWSGGVDGSFVDGAYSRWNDSEPNDSGGDEDCAEFRGTDAGGWNDLPCNSTLEYYVVEFGAENDMPIVESTQFTVNVEGPAISVGSCEELQVADDEGGNWYATITLENDIDCEGQTISPLFSEDTFQGTFDGDGHTISNFVIDQPEDSQAGLLSQTEGDVIIRDLNLENVSVTASYEAGALLGGGDGGFTITNVHATNVDVTTTAEGLVGGLIGDIDVEDGFDSLISNVSVTGNVTASGEYSSNVGGLIGMAEAQSSELVIEKSYADVDITNDTVLGEEGIFSDVGGLIGEIEADNDYSGGDTANVVVRDTYAWGNIEAENSENVGGLIGRVDVENDGSDITAFTSVQRSYARGSVTGLAEVGGLIGQLDQVSDDEGNSYILENNFAMGRVTELDEDVLTGHGGLVGQFEENSHDVLESEGNYIDEGRTTQDVCNSIISMEGCVVTNIAAEPQSNYFINNTTNAPLNTWDFEDVWVVNEFVPPTFAPYELGEDLNGDQIADVEQPNISGYTNSLTGKRVAIDVGENCELTTDDMMMEANLAVQDPSYEYEHGLWDFEAECQTPGATTTIKLFYYDVLIEGLSVRKFNPNTNTYFTIEGATLSQESINGSSVAVATYQITDGGELDMDGVVDGKIEDPAGIATQASLAGNLASTGQSTALFIIIASLLTLASSVLVFSHGTVKSKA